MLQTKKKQGMTHLAMLPHIKLNGDSAVATGNLLIVMPDSAASLVKIPGKGVSPGFLIYQVTVNKYTLVRTTDGWKVTQRIADPFPVSMIIVFYRKKLKKQNKCLIKKWYQPVKIVD